MGEKDLLDKLVKVGFSVDDFDSRDSWGVGAIGKVLKLRNVEVKVAKPYCGSNMNYSKFIKVSYKGVCLVDEEFCSPKEIRNLVEGTIKMCSFYSENTDDVFENKINF